MYLSKSKYTECVQCNKILWLDKYKSKEASLVDNESVFNNGIKVGCMAKNLFGEYINIEYDDNLDKMIEETNKHLDKDNVIICEASFNYNDNFCSVDILKKEKDNYEIYEVKSSTKINDIYVDDISYQYYVLSNLKLNVTKCCIVYINNEYIRHGKLDLNKLFIIDDVTDIVLSKQNEVKEKIEEINKYMDRKEEEKKDIDMYCFDPYECPYFKYCSSFLPEKNIFNIRMMSLKKKFDYYKKGIYKYEDLINEKINNKYLEQIDFDLNNKEEKINKDKIIEFMNTLSYPLYFLDFETYQEPIPAYDNMYPYEQIPFQYSLHYIDSENGKLKHTDYLAETGVDPRRDLALRLVSDIPDNVCVLAYNMAFEKRVIKKLALIFPDLKEHLMCIHNNMKDLMIPFKDRDYYKKEMEGSYSIKYVLPALYPDDPELDYHNLEMIHNGSEASSTFVSLDKYSKEEQKEIRKIMLKYCELDTYAMVKIWQRFNDIINDKYVYKRIKK